MIDQHCTTEWAVRFAGPWADFEHAGLAKIKAEPGQVLTELTPAQLARVETGGGAAARRLGGGVKRVGARSGRGR